MLENKTFRAVGISKVLWGWELDAIWTSILGKMEILRTFGEFYAFYIL